MALYLAQACPACHRLPGLYYYLERGPALSRIGARRSFAEIKERLQRPQQANPRSPMPPLELTAKETSRLVLFLVAQVGVEAERGSSLQDVLVARGSVVQLWEHFPRGESAFNAPLKMEPMASPSAASGALWARRAGCRGCHRFSEGERGVPDLGYLANVSTTAELRAAILRPEQRFPRTLMPAAALPGELVQGVVDFVSLQKRPLPSSPKEVLENVCRPCHGPGVDPKVVVLSPRPPLLHLSRRKHSLSPTLFVTTVAKGRRGSAMAPWGRVLSVEFISQMVQQLHRGHDEKGD
jgi:hypothetical protein